jgi:hypothetical protein
MMTIEESVLGPALPSAGPHLFSVHLHGVLLGTGRLDAHAQGESAGFLRTVALSKTGNGGKVAGVERNAPRHCDPGAPFVRPRPPENEALARHYCRVRALF